MVDKVNLQEEWIMTQKDHRHNGGVEMTAFCPEFGLMCTIASPDFSKSDNSVKIFKLDGQGKWDGKKPRKLKCPGTLKIAQIATCKLTDNTCLITGISNGVLVLWKISSEGKSIGKPTIVEETGYYMLALSRLNNGKAMIATGEPLGGVSTWIFDENDGIKGPFLLDKGLGEEIYQEWDREHPINRIVLNELSLYTIKNDDLLILAEAREYSIKVRFLDFKSKQLRDPFILGGPKSPCTSVFLNSLPNNGVLLISGWNNGNIQLHKFFNTEGQFKKDSQILEGQIGMINSLSSCVLSDGVILIASSGRNQDFLHSNVDQTVRIWELNLNGVYEDKPPLIIEGYHDYDSSVSLCPLINGGAVLTTTVMNERSLRLFKII